MTAAAMTPRERVVAAMTRQPVDYVPCSPLINPLSEAQRRGRPWNFPWPSPGDGLEYLATVLGVDPVVGAWWLHEFHPHDEVTSHVWQDGDTLHKVWTTPAGELHAAVLFDERWPHGRDVPFFTDFVGHFRVPWLKTEHDLECLRHILLPPRTAEEIEGMRGRFEGLRSVADQLRLPLVATIGAGLSGALWLCGAEQVCLLAVDDPGLLHSYIELEHRWNMRLIELAVEWRADIIRRSSFYESALYFSPAMLEQFLGRCLPAEARAVHGAGLPYAYTAHSGVMPMLDWLAGLELDCVMQLDIAFDNVDLRAVQAKLGGRKSFWTGPSNTFHMYERSPEVVRQAVRDVFAVFGTPGLLITACSSSHPMMPWENTLAMIEEWRRLR